MKNAIFSRNELHNEGTAKTINIQNAQKNCRKNISEENGV